MKNLLITGGAGKLGRTIVSALGTGKWNILVLDLLPKDVLKQIFTNLDAENLFSIQDFYADKVPFQNIDAVVHCAFARSQEGKDLAKSIDFSKEIFTHSVKYKVPKVINISSQSLYGGYRTEPSKETDDINPLDMYAVAKYACELLGRQISENSNTKIINVRLASLIGPQFPERFVYKMANYALNNGSIKIVGGNQVFSFLDIQDAADGICCILNSEKDLTKIHDVYNLGGQSDYGIDYVADTIAGIIGNVKIDKEPADIKQSIKLDSSRIKQDFGWQAKKSLKDSMQVIIDTLIKEKNIKTA